MLSALLVRLRVKVKILQAPDSSQCSTLDNIFRNLYTGPSWNRWEVSTGWPSAELNGTTWSHSEKCQTIWVQTLWDLVSCLILPCLSFLICKIQMLSLPQSSKAGFRSILQMMNMSLMFLVPKQAIQYTSAWGLNPRTIWFSHHVLSSPKDKEGKYHDEGRY